MSYWISYQTDDEQQNRLMMAYQTYVNECPLLAYCYAGLAQLGAEDKVLNDYLAQSPFNASGLHQLINVKQA